VREYARAFPATFVPDFRLFFYYPNLMNTSARLDALRAQLAKLKCDALAVSHPTNVRYLTGYSGSSGLVLITRDEPIFFTDFRYQQQAAAQVGAVAKVKIAPQGDGLWKAAMKTIKKRDFKALGFEAQHLSVASFGEIQKMAGKNTQFIATQGAVEKLRAIKSDEELAVIREAVRIADEVMQEALEMLRPGLSELEVAYAIERGIRARGGSGTSFETIVASGARSALPHGVASDKIIEKGDLVTIDMGALYHGYCSDMTRTVCVGKAGKKQREIYGLVYRAQVAACQAIRAGANCKAIDAVARDMISEAGYGDDFGHGLGHGVGVDIHEAPRLAKAGKGSLKAGMVVTSEPGVYLADWGGVRIEDMLVVTDDGADILTQTPKPKRLLEVG